jgi:DNA-binding response OmpR family regulator
MKKILLVEDNDTLGYALKEYLELNGYEMRWAKDGVQGWEFFDKYPVDLCLLDVMMPGQDGFGLAQKIRLSAPEIPLIFLTARALKVDKLKGFGLGADDYIVKPVEEEELVARIEAVLRRSQQGAQQASTYEIGSYTFDPSNQTLSHTSGTRTLTEREVHLLQLLCEQKGQLLPREKVLKTLWDQNDYFTRRSMDVFISRLRKYLRHDEEIEIQNVYGSGFILKTKKAQQ